MRTALILIFFLSLLFKPALSKDPDVVKDGDILIIIDGNKITLDEFERSYRKNNNLPSAEKQTPDEYLGLFINFKLKVLEAQNMGLDTLPDFENELKGYVRQLAEPYLTDSLLYEETLRNSYIRMKKEIHASHIMLMLDEKASPEDTLKAYIKLSDIRNRAANGEDFNTLARTYSEDPSAVSNNGDLGWFGAFKMVYPFEYTAYSTPAGQISFPVRTPYGYHIIKVHESRPALPSLLAAHIFVRSPENSNKESADSAREKVFHLYELLQNGSGFEELAKSESDDKSTGSNGGLLPWFSSGDMIPVFYDAANSIGEFGQISQPVKSFYGWHIIKLLGRKELKSFEEERENLVRLSGNNDRVFVKQKVYIDKLKNDYNFRFFHDQYSGIYPFVDSSVFESNWSDSLLRSNREVIFTIGTKDATIAEFAKYIYDSQKSIPPYDIRVFVDEKFSQFCDSRVLDYEIEMLQIKNPEFGAIVKEYHDGILLFDLTDKIVWTKAVQDTAGLEKFYRNSKSEYTWEERIEAYTITSGNKDVIDRTKDLARKYGKRKKFTPDFIKSEICQGDTSGNCINITSAKYEKGDNPDIDQIGWKAGADSVFNRNELTEYIFVKKKIAPGIKKLDEVKGLVTADYQEYLDNEWIKALREKYSVSVNSELLKKLN